MTRTSDTQSFSDAADSVVVIAVMGMTGSGKSNFIRKVSGLDTVVVGDGLESCTEKPHLYEFENEEGRRVILIDTPGFDDTFRTDADVLQDVANVLAFTYQNHMRLTGLIYLHRIIDPRMTHGGMRNLAVFRKLCGEDPLANVVLATTFWGDLNPKVGEFRENELRTKREYWGDMLSKGARMTRFDNTREGGWAIVDSLASKEKVSLDIQREMVEQGRQVVDTSAGEALNAELIELTKRHQREMQTIQREMRDAIEAHDLELQVSLSEAARKNERMILDLQSQTEVLKADRRDELRRVEMEWDRRLRVLQRQTEVGDERRAELEQMLRDRDAGNSRTEQQIHNLSLELANVRNAAERADYEARIARLRLQQAQNRPGPGWNGNSSGGQGGKGGKTARILGYGVSAIGATAMAVINPMSIPHAISSFVGLANEIFSSSSSGVGDESGGGYVSGYAYDDNGDGYDVSGGYAIS